jgi:hypothetical protein
VQDAGQHDVVDEPSLADEQRAVSRRGMRAPINPAMSSIAPAFRRNGAQSDIALAALAMTSLGVA